jgi:antitoxin ParD1/3/4
MSMEPVYRANDDEYVRVAGPYSDLVRELVESGRYANSAEVVLEGLSLLSDRELLRKAKEEWLRSEIQKGVDSADRGELVPAQQVLDRLAAKYSGLLLDKRDS